MAAPLAAQGSRPPVTRMRTVEEVLSNQLKQIADPVVVIIAHRPLQRLRETVLAGRPQATVHDVGAGLSDAQLHVALAAIGPCDLIIDDSTVPDRLPRVRRYIYCVRPGGVVLVRKLGRGNGAEALRKQLGAVLADVAGQYGTEQGPGDPQWGRTDRARFGQAVRELKLGRDYLVLVAGVAAQAKIREEQIDDLLDQRPDLGRVLARRPGAPVPQPPSLRMSDYDHLLSVRSLEQAPALALREYQGVLTIPGQIATIGSIILPDSYRHWPVGRLRNPFMREIARDFADATAVPEFADDPGPESVRTLPGSYFYLDDEVRGHFGHMTTEVLARLWAWDEAKAADPSLKAILHANRRRQLSDWEVRLLGAAGIDRDDIVFAREPVRVERLVAATPMLSNPYYVHPGIGEIWRRVGDDLAAQSELGASPDRIFIARRIKKRSCRNATDVEQLFESLGFTLVYPEDHPLPDQIRMFRQADAIAGFAGSGMFHLMFTPEPKQVILVTSESYTGRNEWLIAGVFGHAINVAWCRSEAEWRGDHFASGGYQSAFSFDFDREGVFVRDTAAAMERG
ncbi:hypothetical protein GCM10011575_10550 [Microlunatus endophyticus]|uniref:Glycosyltransferase 61 catalytic domain-containing protein n=1 Tax=Microlunatus endophyticus TaxID=1716077 RepID=A0A917S4F3_9ACTN|nr:hypothetical protein GCM10011575_10550 [Microlunatus endophyticus]